MSVTSAWGHGISWPVPNEVVQQAQGGTTPVAVQWHGPADAARVKRVGHPDIDSTDGVFDLAPGWYEVCLVEAGSETGCRPFGVGDVYLVAGQSNAVSQRQPETYAVPDIEPGRVILSQVFNPDGAPTWHYKFRDVGVDSLNNGEGLETAGVAWFFAGLELGRGYPVKFVIVARGNTTTTEWVYTHIRDVFTAWARYNPKAVLWHQGESDSPPGNPVPYATSYINMNAMVESLRNVTLTPWVIALNSTSYPPPEGYNEWPIRWAQRDVIANWPHVFEGPDTDTIRNPGEVEYLGSDIEAHGRLWGQRLLALGL